ncbi:uncharacterized protein LOC127010725 [Drosophila biarmipes]|uniref:uncharacterized protein LOC127010725 n=1 Tax=Drosophila biarmipes TaxID=125945 RepID=UPI0007E72D40|nr:uncharacterized protein LOC127010725 [Drosophila biarmipes]
MREAGRDQESGTTLVPGAILENGTNPAPGEILEDGITLYLGKILDTGTIREDISLVTPVPKIPVLDTILQVDPKETENRILFVKIPLKEIVVVEIPIVQAVDRAVEILGASTRSLI